MSSPPSSLGLDASLTELVRSKYQAAKAAGSLVFAPTECAIAQVNGVPIQVRYAPSLAKKPLPVTEQPRPASKTDPFEQPPDELLIAEVPAGAPTHRLILNKFPIIDNHVILATIPFKAQGQALDEDDLGLTYQCLQEWDRGPAEADGRAAELFAFYNSGRHSGASQAHRHMQLIPVNDMQRGAVEGEWNVLANQIVLAPSVSDTGELSFFRTHRDLPFQHFGVRLPPNATPSMLRQLYLNLYDACLNAVRDYSDDHPEQVQLESPADGSLPISYNLAMTTRCMVMMPRRREGWTFRRRDGSEIGTAALNGTTLAGTVLTKDEQLFKTVQQGSALSELLEAIGIPPSLRRINSTGSLGRF